MQLLLRSSKYLVICFAVIILVLVTAGRYLWNSAAVDDNWSQSFPDDSVLNYSLSGKGIRIIWNRKSCFVSRTPTDYAVY